MYQEAVEYSARDLLIQGRKRLERVFEFYDRQHPVVSSGPSLRSYHPGRIYGSGQYGDACQEARYQEFIRNPGLIYLTSIQMRNYENQPNPRECDFDTLQDDTYAMPATNSSAEASEPVPVEQYWEESYPYDLQADAEDNGVSPEAMDCGEEEEEPFIRGEVVSREAEEIMEREFYIDYWDRQMPQYDEEDPDEIQRRLEERWEEMMEYEE